MMCAYSPVGASHMHISIELFLLTISKLLAMHIYDVHQTIYQENMIS